MKTSSRNRAVRADLYPPLGKDPGPCKIVDRIRDHTKISPAVKNQLLSEFVQNPTGMTNAQARIVYKDEMERGTSPFDPVLITPHAQYRMDLRGVTVSHIQSALTKFKAWFMNPRNRPWLEKLQHSGRIQLIVDGATGATELDQSPREPGTTVRFRYEGRVIVFGLESRTLAVVTTFIEGSEDPRMPPGGCPPRKRADYRAPVNELSGVRTYPSEKPSKGIDGQSGTTTHHSPGESPRSDRDRAAPMRPGQKDELLQKTPANAVFNTPGPSEPGQKIRVRTPGTRGEEYGHPYKLNVMPRRTEAGLYPSYSDRQRDQKGKAKLYYKKYYRRNRGKIRMRAKRDYLRKKNRPSFKRERKYRNSQQYGWRFNRLPAGGYRRPADRSHDYRQQKQAFSLIPFYHPNYGAGLVLDVVDQDVVIRQTDPMGGDPLGEGTVPLFTFLRGVEFDSEQDIDSFFDLADADFDHEDEDEESLRLATFYRETFRPGRNMDPGEGAQNLGEPSPYSPTLPYYDTDRNYRTPGEAMNNISPTDNNPGSAKVIPEGHDFENRKASVGRVAAKMAEILQGIDPGIKSRAGGITPKLKRSDAGNIVYSFDVPGSRGESYVVKVKGIPGKNVRTLGKMDLKLSCTCDFWQYQGPEHWAKVGDYLYGKPRGTASRPDEKDTEGKNRLCKHAVAVLDLIKKWPASEKR